ncbi:hypothetical protein GH714_027443 [Hevea brasiliensis]|uniref:Protein root UVB sensitive/RUS domain-containing protein n=1 Tax=Hevea brasiliensis TaxID=3981 RepID=A0A6A6N2J9_HEVBR|nr:hypothetical protein GH714_027443 [Hevea brasiliensis]
MKVVNDSRSILLRIVESFVNKFFPSGYPYSVNEGYLRYTQFRALQHFSSAALSVLSTQSLLFAAGLRPTPAQSTAVSWGMAVVAARATRLPIYSSFAKEGNLSDLCAKGEAISTLFNEEKFLLNRGNKWTDMVLEQNASGEDALRGWLVAAYAASMEKSSLESSNVVLQDAYLTMNSTVDSFLSELQAKGWHTDRFLDGAGSRYAW